MDYRELAIKYYVVCEGGEDPLRLHLAQGVRNVTDLMHYMGVEFTGHETADGIIEQLFAVFLRMNGIIGACEILHIPGISEVYKEALFQAEELYDFENKGEN